MLNRDSLPRIIPFAIYMAFIFLADMLGRAGWPAAELRWLYAVKIAAVLAALLAYRRRYSELAWRRIGIATLAAAAACGLLVLVLWLNLSQGWMRLGSSVGFDPHSGGSISWPLAAVRLAGGALVVPVMEELFWRSFLMRWVDVPDFLQTDPARVGVRGFVVTVILFGFEHNLWLAGMAAGAVYSMLYMRCRSLWPAIVAHGVTNGALGAWIIATASWTYW